MSYNPDRIWILKGDSERWWVTAPVGYGFDVPLRCVADFAEFEDARFFVAWILDNRMIRRIPARWWQSA